MTVPNVALSPEVQQLLDAITKSRLETEKADQDRLKAIAQGEASKAEQEAADPGRAVARSGRGQAEGRPGPALANSSSKPSAR